MALTTAQRNALPRSAFQIAPKGSPRSKWRYPVPTKAQARKAGISEASRQRTHKAALSYGAQRRTKGSYPKMARAVKARGRGISTIHGRRGTTAHPGHRRR